MNKAVQDAMEKADIDPEFIRNAYHSLLHQIRLKEDQEEVEARLDKIHSKIEEFQESMKSKHEEQE